MSTPRVVVYHQTTHYSEGQHCSLLPLIGGGSQSTTAPTVTHVILAALHVNGDPNHLTLNDHPPDHPRYDALWAEVPQLQARGVKVLVMLGGAAQGTYQRLSRSIYDDGGASLLSSAAKPSADKDKDDEAEKKRRRKLEEQLKHSFEAYYQPLVDFLHKYNLDGIDLDVEELVSLPDILYLINRLHKDCSLSPTRKRDFMFTAAPVAPALVDPRRNLSGFDYRYLEHTLVSKPSGPQISFYNAQFYCGWGDASTTQLYDLLVSPGITHATPASPLPKPQPHLLGDGFRWPVDKVVMGLVTNPANAAGYVPLEVLGPVIMQLTEQYGSRFGGVMGWEYCNSLPGGESRPWEWSEWMTALLGRNVKSPSVESSAGQPGHGLLWTQATETMPAGKDPQESLAKSGVNVDSDGDDDKVGAPVPTPAPFPFIPKDSQS